jgi:hypothetical protein
MADLSFLWDMKNMLKKRAKTIIIIKVKKVLNNNN